MKSPNAVWARSLIDGESERYANLARKERTFIVTSPSGYGNDMVNEAMSEMVDDIIARGNIKNTTIGQNLFDGQRFGTPGHYASGKAFDDTPKAANTVVSNNIVYLTYYMLFNGSKEPQSDGAGVANQYNGDLLRTWNSAGGK